MADGEMTGVDKLIALAQHEGVIPHGDLDEEAKRDFVRSVRNTGNPDILFNGDPVTAWLFEKSIYAGLGGNRAFSFSRP